MPGAYAHITLVNIASSSEILDEQEGLSDEIGQASQHLRFLELGATSPDLSYLTYWNRDDAKRWADLMHYTRSGEVIKEAALRIRAVENTETRYKLLAWLMGYISHVAGDITIHPVIYLLVGDYEGHELEHRTAEMHQDVYIFEERMNLDIALSEHFQNGICRAGEDGNLDRDIAELWRRTLEAVYPDEFARNPPNIEQWYDGFKIGVDKIAEEGDIFTPLARHVTHDVLGLTYPLRNEVDRARYINALNTPTGVQTYDQIFDRAIESVLRLWRSLSNYLESGNENDLDPILNWNLDRGFVSGDERQAITMWS